MNEYNISRAFNKIENELIKSMKRNLSRHLKQEKLEDMNWSMWQAEQLKSLEEFKTQYKELFKDDFSTINSDIEDILKESYNDGRLEQEKEILEMIKNGKYDIDYSLVNQTEATFFSVNERKLNALISETQGNVRKAETSILRYTDDQYRQIIYDAQVYANTGAGTTKQAIDMATQDFLSKGINNIQYANGAMVNIASYAEMAIRTANTRAKLQGEGSKRQEWGIHTVLVPNRNGGCPYCIRFQGKAFVDDVWSGGTAKESKSTGYPLLSSAVEQGLFHPNCKDTTVTYYPEINTEAKQPTKEQLKEKEENYKKDQKLKYIDRNIDKYKRLELGSLDEANIEKYHNKRLAWEEYKKKFKENNNLNFSNKVTNSKVNDIILTDDEQYALNRYLTSDSYVLNESLRNNEELDENYTFFRNKLDNALDKLDSYNGNVVRVLQIEDENKLNQFIKKNKIGKEIEFNEYLSFSDKNGYNDNSNIFIYTQSKTAKDLRKYNKEESELLYRRNSKFLVENVVKEGNKYYILWRDINE